MVHKQHAKKLTRLKFIKISNSWQFATTGTAADKE